MKHYFTTKAHIINHSIIHLYLRNVTEKPRKTIATCIHMLCVYMYIHVYFKKNIFTQKTLWQSMEAGKSKISTKQWNWSKVFQTMSARRLSWGIWTLALLHPFKGMRDILWVRERLIFHLYECEIKLKTIIIDSFAVDLSSYPLIKQLKVYHQIVNVVFIVILDSYNFYKNSGFMPSLDSVCTFCLENPLADDDVNSLIDHVLVRFSPTQYRRTAEVNIPPPSPFIPSM